jgi:hypothetical protein
VPCALGAGDGRVRAVVGGPDLQGEEHLAALVAQRLQGALPHARPVPVIHNQDVRRGESGRRQCDGVVLIGPRVRPIEEVHVEGTQCRGAEPVPVPSLSGGLSQSSMPLFHDRDCDEGSIAVC